MSEAARLLAAFESSTLDIVMDGNGVVIQRIDGFWYRTDRRRPRPMTTPHLLRQLCPDLADEIDELTALNNRES